MKITSDSFTQDARIPAKHTCDGEDVSPPLSFREVPPTASSLALVVDDPDAPAGVWDHWVVWNVPPASGGLAEGATPEGVVGRNSWNRSAWGGPCPPRGEHRYVFRLFALDTKLDLPPSAGRAELERTMKGHVLAKAELTGRYARGAR